MLFKIVIFAADDFIVAFFCVYLAFARLPCSSPVRSVFFGNASINFFFDGGSWKMIEICAGVLHVYVYVLFKLIVALLAFEFAAP